MGVMGVLQEVAGRAKRVLVPELGVLQEAAAARRNDMELLQERLAELELALEDVGWTRLGWDSEKEFSRDGLRRINQLARLYWLKNPLVKRAVLTQTQYVFGQGVNIQARHPLVNAVIQAFLDDPKNQVELTSHQARMIKETELQCFANLFFVFFISQSSGRVRVRTINADEIEDVICNPEDAKEPWYYKRSWTERRINLDTGQEETKVRVAYYPDWRYRPKDGHPKKIGDKPVDEAPVYHVKVNALSDMKLGVSEIYAAMDWARAYKEFLENWATIVKAYARFAWNLVTKGGLGGVSAAKQKLQTTLGRSGAETNPPPATGSVWISTEGTELKPIRTAGATTTADDGRRLSLMVSSATGIFEHYLTGDPSTGNLATAKAMERPMELMFRDRQQLWADVLHDILQFVVDCSARAPSGKLPGDVQRDDEYDEETVVLGNDAENEDPELAAQPIDRHIDVTFPAILEKDVAARVKAIVDAATLDGKPPAGTLELKHVTRLLLLALGEQDVDEILDRMFPPGEEGAEGAEPKTEEPSIEALMIEAVRELREAVARLAAAA